MTTAADILAAIIEHKQAHDGTPDQRPAGPTVRELTPALRSGASVQAVGLRTTSSIHHHLERLRLAGLIRHSYATARGVEVVGATWLPPPTPPSLEGRGPGGLGPA